MSHGILTPLFVLLLAAGMAAGDTKQEAADLAAKSAKHYKRGEFEQAAALLREAYDRYPEPNLLYNLARALEGVGDRLGAIDAYERYLSSAKKIEDRGGIERRVATLRAELEDLLKREAEKQKPAAPPPPPPPKPVVTPVVPVVPVVIEKPEQPPPKKQSRSVVPWVTLASGAAVIGAGAYMAYRAHAADEDSRDPMSGVDGQALHDRAKRDALAANVLFVVGGGVVITGVVLAW
jgi:tetratricopeptide (TPR) repeat protein